MSANFSYDLLPHKLLIDMDMSEKMHMRHYNNMEAESFTFCFLVWNDWENLHNNEILALYTKVHNYK